MGPYKRGEQLQAGDDSGLSGLAIQYGVQTRFTILPFLIVNSVTQGSARTPSWPGLALGERDPRGV